MARTTDDMRDNSGEAPIGVALIGYGFAGKTFHAPLIATIPGLELCVVASRDADKVHTALPDVDVVDDPLHAISDSRIDLVVIASPNDTHAPLARAALEAGKHVVVDKPFALTLQDARDLAALATRQERVLSVFQNRRWDSDFLTVCAALADDRIGRVVHVESHIDRFRPRVRARWREQAGAGGGLWYDLGPHLIDQALLLFGIPARVHGHVAILRDDGLSDDWAHVLLEYDALRVVLHASMLVAGGSARFVVHGTRGSLVKPRMDQQEAQLLAGSRPGDGDWGVDDDALLYYDGDVDAPQRLPAMRGDQSRFYAQLCDAIRAGDVPPVTPLQAIGVMAVLEAAITSSHDGRAVAPDVTPAERAAWPAG